MHQVTNNLMNASDTPPLSPTCPKCRAPLPLDAPCGLCPTCLLDAAGVESEAPAVDDPFAAPLDPLQIPAAPLSSRRSAPNVAGASRKPYPFPPRPAEPGFSGGEMPDVARPDRAWVERFTFSAAWMTTYGCASSLFPSVPHPDRFVAVDHPNPLASRRQERKHPGVP